jgi:excisionase family DNA binding protein
MMQRPRANGGESANGISVATFDSQSLLTIEDVAELLKVPVSWVYERTRRRANDRIPGFRLGKYWRFREADLLAWLDRQRAGGRTNA